MTAASDQYIAEVPNSCTCTWDKRAGDPHWRRIGPKEDCPWHAYQQFTPRPRRTDPLDYQPEWLDQDIAWRRSTLGERPEGQE